MQIKTLVRNMRDELDRAESALSWLYTEHPEIYSEIQNSEFGDVFTQDIRDELERTENLTERIDLAMLMSAHIGNAAIPTIDQIYQKESEIEIPYDGNCIDTETVYNMIDEWCSEIKQENQKSNMNVFGFIVRYSRIESYVSYLVFADNEEDAKNKVSQAARKLRDNKNGWFWGAPIVKIIPEWELHKLDNANLIW